MHDTTLHRPSSSRWENSFCMCWQRTHSPQLLNFLHLSASQRVAKRRWIKSSAASPARMSCCTGAAICLVSPLPEPQVHKRRGLEFKRRGSVRKLGLWSALLVMVARLAVGDGSLVAGACVLGYWCAASPTRTPCYTGTTTLLHFFWDGGMKQLSRCAW